MAISVKTIKSKKFLGVVAILSAAAVLAAGYFFIIQKGELFGGKPSSPARFILKPIQADAAGVASRAGFILQSSESLSVSSVGKIVKFEPEIGFKVKKASLESGFIATAFAREVDSGTAGTMLDAFEITPEQALAADSVYRIVIDDPEYADREYSWAFQVRSPFQVSGTLPGDKATGVPVNSVIEITFNRENLISPENYFEITPKIEGTFEQLGETLVFKPKILDPETVYNILIKNGLKAVDCDDQLLQDYYFSFETGSKSADYRRYASFNFQDSWSEFQPNQDIFFSVWPDNIDLTALQAEVYRFGDETEFLQSYGKITGNSWAQFSLRNNMAGYTPPLSEKVFSFQPTILSYRYQHLLELPQKLDSGYYFLRVWNQQENIYSGVWFQVGPLSHYYAFTHDKGFFWLYDFITKKPVNGASVSSFSGFVPKESSLGSTGQDGLLNFNTPASLQAENQEDSFNPRFFRVEKSGYLPVIVKVGNNANNVAAGAQNGSLFWNYLSTDKPLYKPNDTLKFWGVVKARGDADFREKRVEVGIYQGYFFGYGAGTGIDENKFLLKREVMVSPFSTIEGELSFSGLAPGYYNLLVRAGGEIVNTTAIQVLTYTKPAYQITVNPYKKTAYAGEQVSFKIRAEFFDGTPVAFLDLKYSGYWLGEEIKGNIKLNARGEAVFSYVPRYSEAQDYYYWPANLTLSFLPALSEEAEISGQGNVLVFGPNLHLQASREAQPDGAYKIIAKLNRYDIASETSDESDGYRSNEYIGEGAVGQELNVQIVKVSYRKIITGQTYDPIYKIMTDDYRYEPEEEIIEEFPGITDEKGEWSFSRKLALSGQDVYYDIRFSGRDSQGRALRQSVSVYSFYGDWQSYAKLNVNPEINGERYRKEFAIGQEIDIAANLSGKEPTAYSPVLLYRYQNNIDKVVLTDNGRLTENFSFDYLPSVRYRAVVLGSAGFVESPDATAVVKAESQALDIAITADKEKYQPRDTANIELKIRDKNKKSVKAALNVAVVDEALFHVLSYQAEADILGDLFSEISVTPVSGISNYDNTSASGAEMGGCFAAGTGILMYDGSTKPIEKIMVGDEILTLASTNGFALAKAVVQGISRHSVDQYLIINDFLKITPEHRIFVNGKWQEAARVKVGDALLNYQGNVEKVFGVKSVKERTLVYNIIVGEYHTYFAGGVFVHNEEKGGGTRSEFSDVVLFKSLETDSNGEARLNFKLPDNLTSWRTTVLAFAASELMAGQGDKLLPVSLPFFVDAALNEYYLKDDQPVLRARFFGDGYQKSEPVSFETKCESLGIDIKTTSSNGQAEAQLPALPVGEHQIIVSASQGALSDSLARKIKVVDSYFGKMEVNHYVLSENLRDISGNPAGHTNLRFVEAGAGKFYDALRNYGLDGGVRLDQQAAGFVAQKLLNEHFGEAFSDVSPDLDNYYKEDGGLALLTYGESDLAASAKTADLLSGFVYKEKLAAYFKDALNDKKADLHRISQALYGLSSLGETTLNKINLLKNNGSLSFEDRLYLALALAKSGDKEGARDIYYSFLRQQLRFQGEEAWLAQEPDKTKQVKTTGMIAVLASYLNITADSRMLWQYGAGHYPENDLKSFEEMLFIKSELSRIGGNIKAQPLEFFLSTEQRKINVDLAKEKFYELDLMPDELGSLRFGGIKGEIDLVVFFEKPSSAESLVKHDEISLTRVYSNKKDASRPVNTFSDGDVIEVRLYPKFSGSAIDGAYQIIDYLPAGLKLITRPYEAGLWGTGRCDYANYPWPVINNAIYFTVDKDSFKRNGCFIDYIKYYARVSGRGRYTAEPALMQSLKDPDFLNVSASKIIDIK
ncbi:MAG: polymorphic toxin-type HINT domain-containing protein [Candidatus Pacebacteria bacterium]|nr:polymorphic toxin-type HINT domain-containing protein [Candidatus Paceibacterota bacterium]